MVPAANMGVRLAMTQRACGCLAIKSAPIATPQVGKRPSGQGLSPPHSGPTAVGEAFSSFVKGEESAPPSAPRDEGVSM